MSQQERATEDKKGTRRERKIEQRRSLRAKDGGFEARKTDWRAWVALTIILVDRGGAVRFGATRDGGAFAIGIYYGDYTGTEYVKPSEDPVEVCLELLEALQIDAAKEFMTLQGT